MASAVRKTNSEAMAQRREMMSQVFCRIFACAISALAAILMAFNRETAVFGNVQMQADYTTVSTFKFFIAGNAVVSAFCLFTLPMIVSSQGKSRFMHAADLVIMGLEVAAAASATAVSYVGKYGNESAGWMPVCGYFPNFCNKTEACLAINFLGCGFCYIFSFLLPVSELKPSEGTFHG
ncbi:hypothetical protein Taro_053567 [Colocasia esculenta]|uniref:CASP-like protein n=1 Tax=Colocasia esculenta TaxID=4460 RepID=A0A843XNI1_COLES|nr:hypothetical protein [Colocasia esculenta]